MIAAPRYRARTNRGGAVLADTRRFLVGWDDALDLDGNMWRTVQENIFAKGSRKQAQAVMYAIRWRYLDDPDVVRGLVRLARAPNSARRSTASSITWRPRATRSSTTAWSSTSSPASPPTSTTTWPMSSL